LNYRTFLESKRIESKNLGFKIEPNKLNDKLFDFQKDMVIWALRKGKCAIFADTGLGKTLMQLEWAKQLNNTALIVAPLAVSRQTKHEGAKFGYNVNIVANPEDIIDGINITNYGKLHKFDLSKIDSIVLDESSILKSQSGKYRTELIQKTLHHKYKLACTATPAPNDYMELGNHSEFLGQMRMKEMLSMFFVNDCKQTQKWRLKRHAIDRFWGWVASWAAIISKPSDLGYKDDGFVLPALNIINHRVESNKILPGFLFPKMAETLTERRGARRESVLDKIELTKRLILSNGNISLVWCDLNYESEMLAKNIDGSVEIKGADSDEHKENSMIDFASGKIKTLITKPQIAGFGMNWQVCNNVIFFGLSDSFERYYQAIRRCWRFGQKKEVNVNILTSDIEGNVIDNINRKEKDANDMRKMMVEHTRKFVIENIKEAHYQKENYQANESIILPDFIRR